MEEDIDAFLAQLGTIAPATNDTKTQPQSQISSTQNRTDHVTNTDISINNNTSEAPKRSVLLPRVGALAPAGLRSNGLRPVGLRPVPMGLRPVPVVSSTMTAIPHPSLTPVSSSLYTTNSTIADEEEEAELLVSIDGTISSLPSSSTASSMVESSATISAPVKNFVHPSRMAQVPTHGVTIASNALPGKEDKEKNTLSLTTTSTSTTTQLSSTSIYGEKRRHSAISISDEGDEGNGKNGQDTITVASAAPPSFIPTQGPLPAYDEQAAIIQANAIANSIALSRSAFAQSSMMLSPNPATLPVNEAQDPKSKKHLRCAAGKIWNDPTLEEWPESTCGNCFSGL